MPEEESAWYSPVEAPPTKVPRPIQETGSSSPTGDRNLRKPKPLPRKNLPQGARPIRTDSATLPQMTSPDKLGVLQHTHHSVSTTTLQLKGEEDVYEECDFTGGTGDSGVGTGGDRLEEWIDNPPVRTRMSKLIITICHQRL